MDSIDKDLRFLSLDLEHRMACTDEELQAAEYVCRRLGEVVGDVETVEVAALENYRLVYAAYYAEFVVTGIVAIWWPTIAFVYGLGIFLAYVAESLGFPVFSRLLPHSKSECVAGAIDAKNPVCAVVFTAYLDAADNPCAQYAVQRAARFGHIAACILMLLVVATCAVDAMGTHFGIVNQAAMILRWISMGILGLFAMAVFMAAQGGYPVRGANHNASGIAALLYLAKKIRAHPIKNCSVFFFFPGSHYASMAGMRYMMSRVAHNTPAAFIINMEGVGAGNISYSVTEGILPRFRCAAELISAAQKHAKAFRAQPAHLGSLLTNAHMPLASGRKAISIIGLNEENRPVNYCEETDTYMTVDATNVKYAARFAEAIARDIALEM